MDRDQILWRRALETSAGRREFLASSAGAVGALLLGALPARRGDGVFRSAAYPFTLGVASGDPAPDGFVLWTRLAPDPVRGGGMPDRRVSVAWEVATDDGFRRVVRKGQALAVPELAHSVHVEVEGLEPGRDYWYRFVSGGEASAVGRARTAPAAGARVDRLDFAFVSCQNYEHGYFTALRHLAGEDLELVVHLGDYIYEYGPREGYVRPHEGPEVVTLEQYRNRYALYKLDPDLQAAHSAFPFVVIWDDHEVDNNYAGAMSEDTVPPAQFLARRAAAYQAYYEHMPLRRGSVPRGPDMRIFRRIGWGGLAQFHLLDTRQYRTDQPCGDGRKPRCAEAFDPAATLTGEEQERWLLDGLDRSEARWNILGNQLPLGQLDGAEGEATSFSMDKWDGYVVQRRRLLRFLHERRPANPVVITGDIHSNWAMELKEDFDDVESAVVGVELVGTSITSGGDGTETTRWADVMRRENPHLRYFNNQRGYVRCRVTPDLWNADYRVVPFVTRPDAPIGTHTSFAIEAGRPGLHRT